MFVVMNTSDSGMDSLRAAIMGSNADAGSNTISFNIGNGGAQTITLLSALPAITNPVIVDGTTQPGYTGERLISIDGADMSGDGLILGSTAATSSAGSTIEGLIIASFGGAGIDITTDGNSFESNELEADGTGVLISASGSNGGQNTIGGTTATLGNVITHNQQTGIMIGPGGGGENVVEGNTISQNMGSGVEVDNVQGNVIGGTVAGVRNLIYGNIHDGVFLTGDYANNNLVAGNWIGTFTGSAAFGNQANGVEVDAMSNIIGGTTDLGATSSRVTVRMASTSQGIKTWWRVTSSAQTTPAWSLFPTFATESKSMPS